MQPAALLAAAAAFFKTGVGLVLEEGWERRVKGATATLFKSDRV